jgi:hypothetical protein
VKNACLDAALAELESAGVRDVVVARGSKHPQVRFRINGGPTRVFSVAGTPSDQRAPANTRRDVRVLLRQCGVSIDRERPRKPPPKKPDRISLLERRVAALEHELTKLLKDKSDA